LGTCPWCSRCAVPEILGTCPWCSRCTVPEVTQTSALEHGFRCNVHAQFGEFIFTFWFNTYVFKIHVEGYDNPFRYGHVLQGL
jgi:hypothetical protein